MGIVFTHPLIEIILLQGRWCDERWCFGTLRVSKTEQTSKTLCFCFVPSLFLILKLMLFVFCRYYSRNGYAKEGHQGALLVSVAMALMMGSRAAKSGKFMPAGVVASVSAVAAVWNFKQLA